MTSPFVFLPPAVRGTLAAFLLAVNTIACCTPLFALALVKLLLPWTAVRRRVDPILNRIAGTWVACNSSWMHLTQRTQWDVQGLPPGRPDRWYLVNCNHQSWADIFVLQHLLNGRLPILKFFLKQELLYVPVIGLAWWALDFPFMKRHGKEALRREPHRRADDARATIRACAKFAHVPTSVMNFAEGTRFTPAKHARQHSPYRHLLKPKAGALALTLQAMGDQLDTIIDVTIAYAPRVPGFWDFLCGRAERITVRMRVVPLPAELRDGDFAGDAAYRARFQEWLVQLWREKDEQLDLIGA